MPRLQQSRQTWLTLISSDYGFAGAGGRTHASSYSTNASSSFFPPFCSLYPPSFLSPLSSILLRSLLSPSSFSSSISFRCSFSQLRNLFHSINEGLLSFFVVSDFYSSSLAFSPHFFFHIFLIIFLFPLGSFTSLCVHIFPSHLPLCVTFPFRSFYTHIANGPSRPFSFTYQCFFDILH